MKRNISKLVWITAAVLMIFIIGCKGSGEPGVFRSNWHDASERIWIGPEYWANRLQDWKIANSRLECVFSGNNRNVHILTRQIGSEPGGFDITFHAAMINRSAPQVSENWIGCRIGAKGRFNDYRDSAIFGVGIDIGVTASGELFIGDKKTYPVVSIKEMLFEQLILKVSCKTEYGINKIDLSLIDQETGEIIAFLQKDGVSDEEMKGNISLVSSFPEHEGDRNTSSAWFSELSISGEKIEKHEDRAFGPVLFVQYTLSRNIMKMTAQMPPTGEKDEKTVRLQIKKSGIGNWDTISREEIEPLSRTAVFRIENWESSTDIPYRLTYDLHSEKGSVRYYYEGTIRKEPLDKDELVVAGFTGNNDLGFPNNDIVRQLEYHDPDLMFFSGDQIYEGVAGFGVQRAPMDKAVLDYLRKWYLLGWAYGDLMRNRPVISIPDDHDVYHGNVWGAGGKAVDRTGNPTEQQDSGGYKMPPEWVNMVQRTQTSNLPDPYDPAPVLQDIGVYYCNMNYGGISFAVIEDRKFKSAPKTLVPKGEIVNGWPQSDDFNAAEESDVPGAVLLGDRQLSFLKDWASEWNENIWMKVVLSQTIFSNVATLPVGAKSGAVIPGLPVLQKGEYAQDQWIVNDFDSNGWPQTGRKKALREMRKAFAFHIAGDQHLGSTIQYGVDGWKDAGFAFCVPAISNIWPRRWFPSIPGQNRLAGSPEYTGDFRDGFGNFMTVHAVSNPYFTGKEPSNLYDRATGYGIVRFRKEDRSITIECYPRWSDPSMEDAEQYPGWPIMVDQMENYSRDAVEYLPELEITGMSDPVVQIINEKDEEIIYTIRIDGGRFQPKVFEHGIYTVKVGEPDTGNMKILSGRESNTDSGSSGKIIIEFQE